MSYILKVVFVTKYNTKYHVWFLLDENALSDTSSTTSNLSRSRSSNMDHLMYSPIDVANRNTISHEEGRYSIKNPPEYQYTGKQMGHFTQQLHCNRLCFRNE